MRQLFIDYRSAFSTIVQPDLLVSKLIELGLNSLLCDWNVGFLLFSPPTLQTGDSEGCVLSPLLFSFFL